MLSAPSLREPRLQPCVVKSEATYPVAAYTPDGLVVAWTDGKSIHVLRVLTGLKVLTVPVLGLHPAHAP